MQLKRVLSCACVWREPGTFSSLASQVTCFLFSRIHKTSPNICLEDCKSTQHSLVASLLLCCILVWKNDGEISRVKPGT